MSVETIDPRSGSGMTGVVNCLFLFLSGKLKLCDEGRLIRRFMSEANQGAVLAYKISWRF